MFKLLPALLFLPLLLALAPVQAQSKELQCTVNAVHDGDSMRVLCPGQRGTLRLRLQQIDAPELEQAYGLRSRDHLRSLCPAGATVIIQSPGHDQYDRLLGDAWCDGRNVNEEMVAAGAAWPYERYVEDRRLFRLQDQARERKVGLWAAKAPQKPWVWRAEQRNRR